ncbi:MAG: glutamine--fructose-6-phosphate transaminase (isomerizing) [Dehalococcoidales bacterium]|nr:glutamine--fructose-6-phosphate transaminase (isomerizing) [Dehalococcoidales bacterium]
MCGIVGYIGNKPAQPILLRALKKLEYRGYDSSGIAVLDGNINIYKDICRVAALEEAAPQFSGDIGIGHTRWATHGEPSQANAHPQADCRGEIAVVHNGVIINYQSLKDQLMDEGHIFLSETDTEVISHLIEKYYQGYLEEAVTRTLDMLKGSYAIAVIAKNENKMVVARQGSPLAIGLGTKETLIASDIPPLLEYTNRVIYLDDGEMGVITRDDVNINRDGRKIAKPVSIVDWDSEDVQMGGYDHFMLKEIHEQPKVIRQALLNYDASLKPVIGSDFMGNRGSKGLLVLACGTSYHAGLVAKYIIEELLDIPVRVELASEVNHRQRIIPVANVIAITQSGETADVLISMKKLIDAGCSTLAITNVRGSSVSRIADHTLYTQAGPELSVAATKSFTAQLMELYKLLLSQSAVNEELRQQLISELRLIPHYVQRVLDNEDHISECARFISQHSNMFYVGRGINYPIALEGALKIKEISYIHAEGYAAGELKHGPFSLLQPDTPVVAIVNRDLTYDAMITNIKEIKSRKSPVIALVREDDRESEKLADMTLRVPNTHSIFSPIINTIAMQLLAYYTAKYKGCPIDFPRNLAKSVTVE